MAEQGFVLSRGPWVPGVLASVELELPGGSATIARARHGVIAALGGVLGEQERSDLELLVSELVTNAVRHGGMAGEGDTIWVHAALTATRLRLEVCDSGPGFEAAPPRPRDLDRGGGGLGLVLLDRLAERWGVAYEDGTACVWAEFARGALEEAA